MLENYWHIACRSRSLKNRPLRVTRFDRPLVLFRNDSGQVGALEDRCAHRNMPLSSGCIKNGHIQCSYHGWAYNTQGELVELPTAPDNIPKVSIPAYNTTEQDGYVWLSKNPKTVSEPPHFPNLGKKGWASFHMHTKFKAPVASCLENFLDVPHASFVHRTLFRTPHRKKIQACVSQTEDGAVAEYFEEPRKKSLVFGLLSKSATKLKHTDRFIAPSMSRVDYAFSDRRHYIITSFCSPIDEFNTDVFTVITFHYGWWSPVIRPIFEAISRIIIKQDVKTLNKQYQNIKQFGEERFMDTPQDLLYRHIKQWRHDLAQGYQPTDIKYSSPRDVELHV